MEAFDDAGWIAAVSFGFAAAAHRRCRCRSSGAGGPGRAGTALMLAVPAGVRVWLASSPTDMLRGMNSLVLQMQVLKFNPHGGDLFVCCRKRRQLANVLW